jgi:putative phosphoribosyl transferase
MRTFDSRNEAGFQLGAYIEERVHLHNTLVLGMPRGGVVVADGIAEHLQAPLDVVVPELVTLAADHEVAIAAAGHPSALVAVYGPTPTVSLVTVVDIEPAGAESREEIRSRTRALADSQARMRGYRRGLPPRSLRHHDVVIVSDGVISPLAAVGAVRYARNHEADRVIIAAPVCSQASIASLGAVADDVLALASLPQLPSVSRHYHDPHPVSDDDVVRALHRSRHGTSPLIG